MSAGHTKEEGEKRRRDNEEVIHRTKGAKERGHKSRRGERRGGTKEEGGKGEGAQKKKGGKEMGQGDGITTEKE